jgi:hypothetical protein
VLCYELDKFLYQLKNKYDGISCVFIDIKKLNHQFKSLCMYLIKQIENYLYSEKNIGSSIPNQPKLISKTHNPCHELSQVQYFFNSFYLTI